MWTRGGASELDINPEKEIPVPPETNRQLCIESSRSLQDFLRLSRTLLDDTLRTRLNSITKHHEDYTRRSILPRRDSCQQFVDELLLPQWQARASRIKYCLRQADEMVKEVETQELAMDEEERNRLLRIDPYALKDLTRSLREKRASAEQIRNRYQNEIEVEEIIQERSHSLIKDVCGQDVRFDR
ncbi:hypothetical protein KL908_001608 [Ogataea polymorpha]|nr:hypothetical protein KL908_001608 [Ogataea polymorpha]